MKNAALAIVCLLLSAVDVSAQSASPRVAISIGGGIQTAAPALQDRFDAFESELQEKGEVTADYRARSSKLFDGGFAVRLQRRIRAGLAVSFATAQNPTTVEAQVPHPFHFNRHRAISGDIGNTDRTELGIHAQLQYLLPLTSRLHAVLAAGPTYFDVKQELVNTVQFNQEYPYDTATFQSATTRRAKGTGIGFNAGADIVWTFSRHVGIGGTVRYTRGTIDLHAEDGRDASVDAGALQGSAGLRLFF